VSVTALLDLVLILLLVTLVSVPFIRGRASGTSTPTQPAVEIAQGPPESKIELSIHPDQSLWLDGKKVSGADLLSALKKRLDAKPESGVLVNMSANFAAGSLASLMEEMHKLGVKRTSVNVVDAKKKP
jgi:biopolymer transport protein ExbD